MRTLRTNSLGLATWLLLAATLAAASGKGASPAALTNKDIWTLAEAGFSEEFIVETIETSRSQFDISSPALAEMVKHAVTERIVRTMKIGRAHV
jgi:hypothetical protein